MCIARDGGVPLFVAMTRATGPLARRILFLVVPWFLLLAPKAAPGAPAVHVLSGSPRAGSPPLVEPGRAPLANASSLRVGNAAADGIRTNGKIVGVDAREGPYSCSGTALNTPSRSIVLTAAHCVMLNGNKGKRIAFVPAYDHGKRPYGTFHAKSVYLMRQWLRNENPDFDVAALKVRPNRLGFLTDVVGSRGYVTSRSRRSAFEIFGYPAAALEGRTLRSCRAHGLGSDSLTYRFAGPPTVPASCDMAAGSSGGAWTVDGQYINGVTSYSYEGRPTQLFSPYFGPAIGRFLRRLP